MVNERFIVNPFTELALTPHDRDQLKELTNSLVMANLDKYTTFPDERKKGVDPKRWKVCKRRQGITMYVERQGTNAAGENITGHGLPLIWGLGKKEGKLDDLMFGLVSPTLEAMRVKAPYVDDFSGAAALDSIVEPSLEEPFQALIFKWMEVDTPFTSTNLVKNRDYVYFDATGFVRWRGGERLRSTFRRPRTSRTESAPTCRRWPCGARLRWSSSARPWRRHDQEAGGCRRLLLHFEVRLLGPDEEARLHAREEVRRGQAARRAAQEERVRDLLGADHQSQTGRLWQERQHVQAVLRVRVPRLQGLPQVELRGPELAAFTAQGHVLHGVHRPSHQLSAVDVARAQMLATGKIHDAPSGLQSSASSDTDAVSMSSDCWPQWPEWWARHEEFRGL
jgi:hypothetical protein